MLSLGLVGCVVAACCWESSVKGGRVVVNMFRGKVSLPRSISVLLL